MFRKAVFLLCLAIGCCGLAPAALADAGELRARHEQLQEQLRNNPYGRTLHIVSTEEPERLTGDVFAVLDHPFARVSTALQDPAHWCDILLLPFNTKYCHAVEGTNGPGLRVRIGRKFDQPLEQAYRIDFGWNKVAAQPDYFESRLVAPQGPVGTRDYRISVAAVPLERGKTFLRLTYSYGYGLTGRLAMQAYLGTVGADKVGFSVVGKESDGQPQYIGGVRGAIERNAMRYYLAIDSYLDSLTVPPAQQLERRIQGWFDATERYPRQLREMDRATYVAMKRLEHERQQTVID
ncbi:MULTISPECIES: hypothetical protein [Ramlibacter]|uniref:Uncharacterized protein n=1 Tax=Ramlibacter pinisoli TaxID=2682844 RepID=A0A6N8IZT0_9BURK|nr:MULTISPECIES: hypothetical protein [Ramlibacter]MBA2962599.1 hypothetical protein [Ramlibacter sp. CGMCC 1.13660]MVQ32541.1 hypothetical protein [Ramlibacter pinisoli]